MLLEWAVDDEEACVLEVEMIALLLVWVDDWATTDELVWVLVAEVCVDEDGAATLVLIRVDDEDGVALLECTTVEELVWTIDDDELG